MAEKQNKYSSGIGGSLILIIFIVLTITVFSVLTLVSAENEVGTITRSAKVSEDYYAAEREAALKCGELNNMVSGLTTQQEMMAMLSFADDISVNTGIDDFTVSFTVEIDDKRLLETVLRPENDALVIVSQKITVPEEIIIDESIDVWDGSFPF